jgi:rubrerythrin
VAFIKTADITELAMELEKSGETFYRAVAEKAESGEVCALFTDLANQEVIHYKVFQKLAQSIREQPFMTDEEWDRYQRYLEATVDSAFFEGPDKALSAAGDVAGGQEAIGMAIRFEKETMLFFYDLLDMVPTTGRDVIEKVIAEEKKHVRRLAGMLSH